MKSFARIYALLALSLAFAVPAVAGGVAVRDTLSDESRLLSELEGRWSWVSNTELEFAADGSCRAYQAGRQVNTCQAFVLDPGRRLLRITHVDGGWIDTVTLSVDGRLLTGANQHGSTLRGDRISGPSTPPVDTSVAAGMVGTWNWGAEHRLVADSDGTCRVYQGTAQVNSCRWVVLDEGRRQVRITHARGGWIDTVLLSPDGRVLTGTNQRGNPVRGDRAFGPYGLPPGTGLTAELVGTWNWVSGQRLVVDSDGTCRVYQGLAQINSCRWVVLDEALRKVRITHVRGGWVDTMTLSPDGRVLTGTNNVGSDIRGDRASGSLVVPENAGVTAAIVGTWNWVAGQRLVVDSDGTCRVYQGLAQINSCRWVVLDEGLRQVRITHTQGGWIDTVTVSEDGRVLEGTNQRGNPLRGEKAGG